MNNIDEMKPSKMKEKLIANEEQAQNEKSWRRSIRMHQ